MYLDPDRIRERLLSFKEEHQIPLTRIGEVLGSKSDTVAGKTMYANKLLKDTSTTFTLDQVNRIAKFMGTEVGRLLGIAPREKKAQDEAAGFISSLHPIVPLLGWVSAATREYIEDDVESWLPCPLLHSLEDVFALRVEGHCMSPMFHHGDIIFVRQFHSGSSTPNGTTVVARVNNEEATLKKYYRRSDTKIELLPENQEYSSIFVDLEEEKVEILGVVKARLTKV